jgi:hypothetical protein
MSNKVRGMAMDGFGKLRPVMEGYVVKGGVNNTTRIVARPPAPKPSATAANSSTHKAITSSK